MPPRFTVKLVTDLPEKLQAAQRQLTTGLPNLLQQLGVWLSAEQRFSFEDKSRGGSGADGRPWKPLARSTELAKYMKGRRKGTKRAAGTRKRRKTPIGPLKRSQIGVDRGLLRNSNNQGFRGPDGDGGNLNRIVNGTTLILENGRSYAKHFDAVRPIYPETMPAAWVQGMDRIVRDWIDQQMAGIN